MVTDTYTMKKHILLILAIVLTAWASAQTQQGYVRTKGRMVNGKVILGEGLPATTIFLKGENSLSVQNEDGSFSFPVPKELKYRIDSVKKKGYQLIDFSQLRTHFYSGDTLFLTMEKPGEEAALMKALERKWHRSSEARLQRLEDSISSLTISLEEKNRQLEAIDQERAFNESCIKELAKYYASIDYNRVSDFQRRVNALSEQGEFAKAIQLLHSKGDPGQLWDSIAIQEQAAAKLYQDIQESTARYNQVTSGISIRKEEFDQWCYSLFQNHFMLHHYDSAAYFLELRASKDSTNAKWQSDAANYFGSQNRIEQSIFYLRRALAAYRNMDPEDIQSYGIDMAYTLNNLANTYSFYDPSLSDECEDLYEEALEICDELLEAKIKEANAPKMLVLANLTQFYTNKQRYSESEDVILEAYSIFQDNQHDTLLINSPSMVFALMKMCQNSFDLAYRGNLITPERASLLLSSNEKNNFFIDELIQMAEEDIHTYGFAALDMIQLYSDLYQNTQQLSKCEQLLIKAVEISRALYEDNPEANTPVLVRYLRNLAVFFIDMSNYTESEQLLTEALEMSEQLALSNPQLYTPMVTEIQFNFGTLYGSIGNFNQDANAMEKSEKYFLEALKNCRFLVEAEPLRYEEFLSNILQSLGFLNMTMGSMTSDNERFKKSEDYYLEVIEIERRLAKNSSEYHNHNLASCLNALGNLYYFLANQNQDMEMFRKCESTYLESLEIGRHLAEDNPQSFEPGLAGAIIGIGNLYRDMGEFGKCEQYHKEGLEIWRHLAKNNSIYESGLAEALLDVAQSEGMRQHFKEGLKLANEALEICRQRTSETPDEQLHYLGVLSTLGNLYSAKQDFDKAFQVYQEMIPKLKTMFAETQLIMPSQYAIELGSASFVFLFASRFEEAEQMASEALTIDISQQWVFTNLAAALLLQGKYAEAEEIYRNMKDSLKSEMLDDLALLEKKKTIPKVRKADVERIRKMLTQE